ncbi:MAG: diacylglycerol kinase [Gammaproteobacteria bacterium HGW-Gammaproteobacteria-15]|nr:MAG: diacylglycerol kinase [Gammaproteobacteria bacterium HGW-Gammaproteobacteria-15]
MKSEATGVSRLFYACKYSWQGLVAGLKSEAALRQEIIILAVLLPVILLVDVSAAERALLLLSIVLVVIIELLNTAIEVVVDRIGNEYHVLSGKAKDLGSAAVLCSLFSAIAVWCFILCW